MLVGERMSKPVITVRPEMPMPEALDLMHKEHIRRLPVVNQRGELVGIVTEADLLKASPSEATSLSIYEVTYLLSKLTIDRHHDQKSHHRHRRHAPGRGRPHHGRQQFQRSAGDARQGTGRDDHRDHPVPHLPGVAGRPARRHPGHGQHAGYARQNWPA